MATRTVAKVLTTDSVTIRSRGLPEVTFKEEPQAERFLLRGMDKANASVNDDSHSLILCHMALVAFATGKILKVDGEIQGSEFHVTNATLG